jgi:membrane-associated phospholipid phosphatase
MNLLYKIPYFTALSWLAACVALPFFFLINKGDEIIYFNFHHNLFADKAFAWLTRLGEFPLLAVGVFILGKIRGVKAALEAVVSLSVTAALVQFIKRVVVEHNFRPHLFFEKVQTLRIIEGIEPLKHHSFPSGHTAAAFCFFATASFYFSNKYVKTYLWSIAALTGMSRIYLLQHFLADVVGGMLLGASLAWAINLYFAKLNILKKV